MDKILLSALVVPGMVVSAPVAAASPADGPVRASQAVPARAVLLTRASTRPAAKNNLMAAGAPMYLGLLAGLVAAATAVAVAASGGAKSNG